MTAAVAELEALPAAVPRPGHRHLDRALREAVDRHLAHVGPDDAAAAVPAVRVACAHLAAGDLEDAYLALLAARDVL